MAQRKYYAVMKGRKTGIFTSWEKCEEQVKGFKGAIYKSFSTREEAEAALSTITHQPSNQTGQRPKVTAKHQSAGEFIAESLCVDAACSGNPGVVEYRGVCTETGAVIFQKSPIPHGTNNLGEFLAIVHALALLKKQGKKIPIYSDSETAILWVRKKSVRTTLKQNSGSEEIFDLVARAVDWLENNEYSNPILKWDTKAWGEIPADFGRK